MLNIALESTENREALFRITAQEMGISEAVIEKDFWVCWMLEILFHHSDYSEHLSFKGGTSLSKVYNLINRFSEDIDLILDWRVLGYSKDEPWAQRSNRQQDIFNKEIGFKTQKFLSEILMPHLREVVQGLGLRDFNFYIDELDVTTIRFVYPQIFKDSYLLQEIRLEIGCLAAWTPMTFKEVTSFAAERNPSLFSKSTTLIRVVEAKRTFWEKATILHSTANKIDVPVPQRYSRHYYDMYQLYKSEIKDEAFNDLDLLKKVVEFKIKFYRQISSKYHLANSKSIELIPSTDKIQELQKDYHDMRQMFFGEEIAFEEIIEGLRKMIEELRAL